VAPQFGHLLSGLEGGMAKGAMCGGLEQASKKVGFQPDRAAKRTESVYAL
jgi:hypothetical protein